MKLGRLILTHREDLVPTLRHFYADEHRTDFLVIAYSEKTIDPKQFETGGNFAMVPFYGHGPSGEKIGNISGQQYWVWLEVAKRFPDIEGWVIHDYDFLSRPSDRDIFSHLQENEYGMIGKAFPVWQEGMKETQINTYPFPQSHRYWHNIGRGPIDEIVDRVLMSIYPQYFQGVKTLFGGYSDFIAVRHDAILRLADPRLKELEVGGLEQVPHTVWAAHGAHPVDMRQYYKIRVLMDVLYAPIDPSYDMQNPAKFWDTAPPPTARMENLKLVIKRFVKRLIGYQGWR